VVLEEVMELLARRNRQPKLTDSASEAAFERFFRDNFHSVVRLAYSVLGDFQRSQDVAQDVLLAAHRRFPASHEPPVGWIRVATVHTALNAIRGERRRERRHQAVRSPDVFPSAEDSAIEREARAEVRTALAQIPRRSAAVLVMRHGGMSYAEMATALGVKVGQIGTLIRRAESALCKELDSVARH